MKKFLRDLLLFCFFAIITYSVCIVLWGTFMPYSANKNLIYPLGSGGHMFSRIKQIPEFRNVDVLFLGSSHAYRGFDPRIFEKQNIRSFNLGSSSQTPIQTEILLKRYLGQLNPKLIVFEVYPEIFSNEGVESSLDIIANDKLDIHTFRIAFKINHIKVYNALIFRLYRQLFNKDDQFIEDSVQGQDIYVNGGYVALRGKNRQTGNRSAQSNEASKKWSLREDQKQAFERIISMLKTDRFEFVLVQAPITPGLYQSYTKNEAIDEYFKTTGTYYNFNNILDLSESAHFYDRHHLNQSGVNIFNAELIRILKADGKLNNREGI